MLAHTGHLWEFGVHTSCWGCGLSSLTESKLLQLWPHGQPWCHASLQLIGAHAELRAWFPPSSSSSSPLRQVHHPWLKPLSDVRHSTVHLWNHGACLTGIFRRCSPVWFNQEIILLTAVGWLTGWGSLSATFVNAGIRLKLPGTECRDPGVSLTITGWYRVGSFLAVASESFSNRIQGPAVWVFYTFISYLLKRNKYGAFVIRAW